MSNYKMKSIDYFTNNIKVSPIFFTLMSIYTMKTKEFFTDNNKLRVIFFTLVSIFTLQSCQKYEDGPMVSFRTRTERVSNQWVVDNYKINGADYTSLLTNYNETFTKNGAYAYSWSLFDGKGTWKFQNNDKEIKLTGSDSQASRTLFILKLEEKSFWYYYTKDDDRHECHMIQK